MPALVAVAFSAAALASLWAAAEIARSLYFERRATEKMIEDFRRYFPGRCLVCSYHRWGVSMGLEALGSTPNPHRCIESASAEVT